QLASDPEAVVELVYAEVLLRRDEGDMPRLDEYLARFPQHADSLRRRWAVHRLIDDQLPDAPAEPTEIITARRAPPALPVLPGLEVLEELGKGGMGVVYKARQVAFGRLVAVKMIRSGMLAGPDELTRFRTEAQAVGRLDHPHVVRVFTWGEEKDCP